MAKGKKDKNGNDIIDLRDKVAVTMNETAPHHTAGEEVLVHPKQAENFVEKGYGKVKAGAKTVAPKEEKDK